MTGTGAPCQAERLRAGRAGSPRAPPCIMPGPWSGPGRGGVMARRRPVHAVVAALAVLAGGGRAADLRPAVLSGEARSALTRLEEARKLAEERKWAEALARVQSALDTGGNELAPIGAGRSVEARRLCHALLTSLPPEALRLYRERV